MKGRPGILSFAKTLSGLYFQSFPQSAPNHCSSNVGNHSANFPDLEMFIRNLKATLKTLKSAMVTRAAIHRIAVNSV